MKYYIIDTHTLVWRLLESKKLSQKAIEVFREGIEGKAVLVIPTIVLLETLSVLKKYSSKGRFPEILNDIEKASMYETCPLNIEVLKEVAKIKNIPESHDRVIVATAKMRKAIIISRDREIRKVYSKTVW